ncbi:MAG: YfhO family protein [Isosphaeraceae bacterium]
MEVHPGRTQSRPGHRLTVVRGLWRRGAGAAGGVTLVCGVLLGASAVCFWPLVMHPGDLLVGVHRGGVNDLLTWALPRSELPRLVWEKYREMPFWSPWWGAGGPLLGNPSSALFYPPNWLLYVGEPRKLISWLLVFHHLVAACGVFMLCRRWGFTRLGALFAGCAYGFSPVLLARTAEGHLRTLSVVSWCPWVLWAFSGFLTGRRFSGLWLVVLLALSIAAGHLQEVYYLIVVLTAFCLLEACKHVLRGEGGWKSALALVCKWCLIGTATAGLAAVELLPLAVYLSQAAIDGRLERVFLGTPGLANCLQLINPLALGGPENYVGPGDYYWETITSFGLGALAASVLGAMAVMDQRRRFPAIWLAGALGFLLAFGRRTPVGDLASAIVPGLSGLRCPGRWLFLPTLTVSVLGGFGVDALLAACKRGRADVRRQLRRAGFVLALLLVLFGTLGVLGTARDQSAGQPDSGTVGLLENWQLLFHPVPLIGLACTAGLATLASLWPGRARVFAAALLLVPVAESSWLSRTILTTFPAEALDRQNPLQEAIGKKLTDSRVLCRQAVLLDRDSMLLSLPKVQSYEPVPLRAQLEFLSVAFRSKFPLRTLLGFLPMDMEAASDRLLDVLAVRFMVLADDDRPPKPSPHWRLRRMVSIPAPGFGQGRRYFSNRCWIWENADALPRAFVVGLVRASGAPGSEKDQLACLDPRKEVLLERDVLPPGPRQGYIPAQIIHDTPNTVTAEVETVLSGYLVLTDTWYPGWSASVDGVPAEVLHANLAFRAVALPAPGMHKVVFTYYPRGLRLGLAISLMTALATTIVALRVQAERR